MTHGPRPPGPKGSLLGGSLSAFRRDPLAFLTRCAREYGDISSFRLGLRRCLLINHPDLIEDVLVTNSSHYRKHFALRLNSWLFGQGILTSEGEVWHRQRRLAAPAFQQERVSAYAALMVTQTERMLADWLNRTPRDMHEDMMQLTMTIAAQALFGTEIAADLAQVTAALKIAVTHFALRLRGLVTLPLFVPTRLNIRIRQARRRLNALVYDLIARRRARSQGSDLLSLLLQERDGEGNPMADKQLRDEVITFFVAGHETTALALTWTWYLLALHPEVEARLVDELTATLRGEVPRAPDILRLPYTEQVIQEAMRLYPPAFLLGREPTRPVKIGDYDVPTGDTVFLSQWVMHRDSRYFDSPEAFRPERWAGGTETLPRYAYFPFGGGPRGCIGSAFAMMEAHLILATVASRWRFVLDPNCNVQPIPLLTLRPRHGLKGTVYLR